MKNDFVEKDAQQLEAFNGYDDVDERKKLECRDRPRTSITMNTERL